MKPNTSNRNKIDKKIVGQEINRVKIQSYEQGYAKALDDVKDKFDLFDIPVLKDWIEKEVAKLESK